MKRIREVQWSGDRGEGSIFFFVDAETGQKISRNLYVAYWAAGKEHLISAKTDDLDDAKRELKRLLRNRENAREGKEALITPKTERITVGELLDANLRRATEAGLASLEDVTYRTDTLKALLGSLRAVDFRPEHVDAYKARRRRGEGTKRNAKASETSIRRELEILNRSFRYAVERGVLRFAPFIEKPNVDNVRGQEIPLEEFPAILEAVACRDTRDFCEWLLLTAMRPKGTRALRWEWLDRQTWTLKVPSEKGGTAREFAIEGTLRQIIDRRLAARRPGCPFIFHHDGEALDPRQVRRQFYAALAARGLATGRAGFTLYDTKKTAAGLLVDSGLSEAEAMAFSGHRTASMFQRYVIRNADRHRESVRRRDAYLEKRLSEKKSADSERVAVFPNVSES
jgi:integrase